MNDCAHGQASEAACILFPGGRVDLWVDDEPVKTPCHFKTTRSDLLQVDVAAPHQDKVGTINAPPNAYNIYLQDIRLSTVPLKHHVTVWVDACRDRRRQNWSPMCWSPLFTPPMCWSPLCWSSLCWSPMCWSPLCWSPFFTPPLKRPPSKPLGAGRGRSGRDRQARSGG